VEGVGSCNSRAPCDSCHRNSEELRTGAGAAPANDVAPLVEQQRRSGSSGSLGHEFADHGLRGRRTTMARPALPRVRDHGQLRLNPSTCSARAESSSVDEEREVGVLRAVSLMRASSDCIRSQIDHRRADHIVRAPDRCQPSRLGDDILIPTRKSSLWGSAHSGHDSPLIRGDSLGSEPESAGAGEACRALPVLRILRAALMSAKSQ